MPDVFHTLVLFIVIKAKQTMCAFVCLSQGNNVKVNTYVKYNWARTPLKLETLHLSDLREDFTTK